MNISSLIKSSLHYRLPEKINRAEWLSGFLVALMISFILGIFPLIVWETIEFLALVDILPIQFAESLAVVEMILSILITIPILYTFVVSSIKRLHDLGLSGWWVIINLTFVAVPFFILYLGFTKSEIDKEKFSLKIRE